ncbi:MAG: sugar phosphate isomerase/epimerase [Akkermansiaceae bacterium]|nr:sugar phosphate isomerase/epimerase [Akkermansiaceae bacterium]
MIRRSILAMIPAASAILASRASGVQLPPSATNEAGFAISLQCWTLREFTLLQAIEMAANAGVTGLELYPGQRLGGAFGDAKFGINMTDDQVQAVRDQLKKNDLVALNFGVTEIPKAEAKARKTFELAKKFNLYGVTTESLGSLDTLEKLAKEYDVKVCFHNHPRPTALWHPDTIWKAIDGRHANLGYCADLGHWAASGLNPLTVIQKIAPRVHSFHIKDRASMTVPSPDQPLGTGIIPLPAILDEVRKHGFAGNVSIEYESNWHHNLPEVGQCVGYLRAYSKLRP